MDQLPAILAYLGAALLVPIFIARKVVGAEWRAVRNACLIWYGFLVLALGGFASQEGLGWVLIFAMFWSIPAIPLIALVLKLWSRLGQGPAAIAIPDPDRRFWQRLPFARMTPAQWSVVALLVTGAIVFVYWQEQRDLRARADVLLQFFGLPLDTRFADVRTISKSPATAPRIEAVVRFGKQQFDAYASSLDNPVIWQQTTPWYDGAPVEIASPENVRWRDLPVPAYAGDRRVRWNRLSGAEVAKLRQGKVLCVALQRKPRSDRTEARDRQSPRFAAKDCSELARTDRGATIVLGALDFDSRTLHMIIN